MGWRLSPWLHPELPVPTLLEADRATAPPGGWTEVVPSVLCPMVLSWAWGSCGLPASEYSVSELEHCLHLHWAAESLALPQ